MIGTNHILTGAITGLATLPLLGDIPTPGKLGWIAVLSGTALVPDLDHPSATPARMWGLPSRGAAILISKATGGHRWGTHDAVLAPLIAACLAWLAGNNRITLAMLMTVLLGLSIRGLLGNGFLGPITAVTNFAVAALAAGNIANSDYAATIAAWLPLALTLGIWAHLLGDLGDLLTPEGLPVPLLWIRDRTARIAIPVFTTGQLLERIVVTPVLTFSFLAMAAHAADIANWEQFVAQVEHLLTSN